MKFFYPNGQNLSKMGQQLGGLAFGSVVAIGNFDGVHLGHQQILRLARESADRLGLPVVVLTFNPHPTIELRPQSNLKLLTTYPEKILQLFNHGADQVAEQPFDAAFSSLSATDFLNRILKDQLGARVVIVGVDFSYGKGREGGIEHLKNWAQQHGIEVNAVSPVIVDGRAVSSSWIRETLQHRNFQLAKRLLGRPFFYRGEVVQGDQRGRLLGFPTANMKFEEKFPLPPGVYVTSTLWQNTEYRSVTNIGSRPTFDGMTVKIETHLIDQNFDLYGQQLEVNFHHLIREEKKFDTVDALKAQILTDVNLARKFQ